MQTLFLAIGLIILIAVNIVLGSLAAMFAGAFDWKRFRKGIYKGAIIFACLALVYLAGWLNQDIIAFEANGQIVNLMQATHLVIFAGYIYYGTNVITKYYKILTGGGAKEKPPD
ncbi:MAG: hypothetical protein CVU97_01520 [Firmicutes bacterium HGW-Firmicutes-21]|nr:MAG: hypothetical protein CVU97_01520 [Firmicutes bacterium HGW-Firmicutes-21]